MSCVVWITGAHGFIGRHTAQAIAQQGAKILGIGHGHWPSIEAERWGVSHWINGEISSSNMHALCALAGRPDIVIHLAGGSSVGAAIAHPREDFFRTVGSTIELLEWLRNESPETLVVAVSSAAVYGAGHEGLISEVANLRPYSPYGQHKLMMESLCQSYAAYYGLRSVVARLFSVYGVGLQKQLLWDICSRLESQPEKLELAGTGEELRDWIDVTDVAKVLAALGGLASVSVPVFNVASGIGTPVREIAQVLIDFWLSAGGDAPPLTFNGISRAGDPFSLIADTSLLTDTGLKCVRPVREGIATYVDWFITRQRV